MPLDASPEEVERRQPLIGWRITSTQAEYEPATAEKLVAVVADTQYAHMVWRLVTFNFGRSALKTREPVSKSCGRRCQVSAPLMLMAELLIYLVAVPLGVFARSYRGRTADRRDFAGVVRALFDSAVRGRHDVPAVFLCYGDYLQWFPDGGAAFATGRRSCTGAPGWRITSGTRSCRWFACRCSAWPAWRCIRVRAMLDVSIRTTSARAGQGVVAGRW